MNSGCPSARSMLTSRPLAERASAVETYIDALDPSRRDGLHDGVVAAAAAMTARWGPTLARAATCAAGPALVPLSKRRCVAFFEVVSAGLAVGACPASGAQALASSFPGVRFLEIAGVAPCTVAVAWATARETPLVRAFVQTALATAAD